MSISTPRFTMKRVIPAATLLLLLGTAAYATNVHFKSGSTPTFDIPALSLGFEAAGDLAGLGPGTVTVTVNATGTGTASCTNPSGDHQPAGHNPVNITSSGSKSFLPSHNGNATFDVTTTAPTATGDCPNANWSEAITSVTYTGATITATQGVKTVFVASCSFTAVSGNGTNATPTDATGVTCQ